MDEWGVFLVIIVVIDLIATFLNVFIRPSNKNSLDTAKVIQENTYAINCLTEKIDDLTSSNKKDHDHFYRSINHLNTDVALIKQQHKADVDLLHEQIRKGE